VSGYISPCTSDVRLTDAKSKLSTAVARAEKALESEKTGKIGDAFDWWKLLYGSNFPNYYY
jgi:hypothetical protein